MIYTINNKLVKCGNKFLRDKYIVDPRFNITLDQPQGSVINADPLSGFDGTIVNLSHVTDPYYDFNNFILDGTALQDNTFVATPGSHIVGASVTSHTQLLLSDLRTLGLSNSSQTLGSAVDFDSNNFICIKFGLCNNQTGSGYCRVNINGLDITSSSGTQGLYWDRSNLRNKVTVYSTSSTSKAMEYNNVSSKIVNGLYRFNTNSSTYTSGVWAEYRIIIDRSNKVVWVYVDGLNTYVKFTTTNSCSRFTSLTTTNNSTTSQTGIRNLYVYSCRTFELAKNV